MYRLIASNTVEEKIYQRQLYKQGQVRVRARVRVRVRVRVTPAAVQPGGTAAPSSRQASGPNGT